ncbi:MULTISPECIES: hypothetical protein [Vibrio harveyi group]|uniref:hypothetical protein n=1 Tax=Vibrio harveyi group TaxID=717610 RepID=UPI000A346F26|nr:MULTISPECIES: hypothetical protein [Vibrio harveyi group]WHP52932.1 hypothetical protein QMY43_25280 [Vibrio parahaemolyticus]
MIRSKKIIKRSLISSSVFAAIFASYAIASGMTFNDLKNRTDNFTTQKPSQATMDNSWRTYNKPAVNDSSSSSGSMVHEIIYLNEKGLATSPAGTEVKLTNDISFYKQLILVFQMQHEGVGILTKTMHVDTKNWSQDSTHTKSTSDGAFYRYTDTSGSDKNRWNVVNFWRTGKDTLWFSNSYNRYSHATLLSVVGVGSKASGNAINPPLPPVDPNMECRDYKMGASHVGFQYGMVLASTFVKVRWDYKQLYQKTSNANNSHYDLYKDWTKFSTDNVYEYKRHNLYGGGMVANWGICRRKIPVAECRYNYDKNFVHVHRNGAYAEWNGVKIANNALSESWTKIGNHEFKRGARKTHSTWQTTYEICRRTP